MISQQSDQALVTDWRNFLKKHKTGINGYLSHFWVLENAYKKPVIRVIVATKYERECLSG